MEGIGIVMIESLEEEEAWDFDYIILGWETGEGCGWVRGYSL